MSHSIFLSYPRPYLKRQEEFIGRVIDYLRERQLEPRTLGVTDYDMDAPLTAIRRLMLESNGMVTIAFRLNKELENREVILMKNNMICLMHG